MRMRVLTTQQQDRVRHQPSNSTQRLDRPSRAAGQIDDEAGTARASQGARERGELAVALSRAAHQLGETRDGAIQNGLSSLRSDVTQTQSGSARGQDNIHSPRLAPCKQRPADRPKAVRKNLAEYDPPAQLAGAAGDGRAGKIGARATRGRIAYRQDSDAKINFGRSYGWLHLQAEGLP